jgi:hypothetical protein
MTEQQIKWASEHDWFVSCDGGTIIVADRYSDGTEIIMPWLLSFRELREWAGY